MEAVIGGKIIELSAFMRKLENSYASYLKVCLKAIDNDDDHDHDSNNNEKEKKEKKKGELEEKEEEGGLGEQGWVGNISRTINKQTSKRKMPPRYS